MVLDDVTSTQDVAREAFDSMPLLVVAGRQQQGRGRQGHEWVNAPRGIAASLAFAPSWPAETWPLIPLVAGLSARRTFAVDLKWPNDLMTRGRKVGGILVESAGGVVVVGLGVNLWWPSPPAGADALFDDDPGSEVAVESSIEWTDALLAAIDAGPDEWGADEYRRACVTIGRRVRWEPHGEGLALDISDEGRLIVETSAGRLALASGDVRHVR